MSTAERKGNRKHNSASKMCANLKLFHILLMLLRRWVCIDPDDCRSCHVRQRSVAGVTLNSAQLALSVLSPVTNELSNCLDCITDNYTLPVQTATCTDFAVVSIKFYLTNIFLRNPSSKQPFWGSFDLVRLSWCYECMCMHEYMYVWASE